MRMNLKNIRAVGANRRSIAPECRMYARLGIPAISWEHAAKISPCVQAKYVAVKEEDVEKIKALLNAARLWNSDLQGKCSV